MRSLPAASQYPTLQPPPRNGEGDNTAAFPLPAQGNGRGVGFWRPALNKVRTVLVKIVLVAVVFLPAAEGMARLDDWFRNDVPLLANPDRDRDLTVRDKYGVHGRPGGSFRKWKLNEFGFRGPEIFGAPAPGRTRLMVLGASESSASTRRRARSIRPSSASAWGSTASRSSTPPWPASRCRP